MDIVVLAGGKTSDALRDRTSVERRADLEIHGKRILDRVCEALREGVGEELSSFVVVGSEAPQAISVPAGDSFLTSLQNGVEACQSNLLLVSACDLAFLEAESVSTFLTLCDRECDLNYPIVPLEACRKAFPNMKRTSLKVREGRFTGGNLFLLQRSALPSLMPRLEAAYQSRKSPAALARIVGVGTLLRVLLGQLVPWTLPIPYLERHVGRVLGLSVHAVPVHSADIGADVDNLEQYEQALLAASPGDPV